MSVHAVEPVMTEITPTDGFNTSVEDPFTNDSGLDVYQISAGENSRQGDNLFHQFDRFNISETSVANFINDNPDINHTNIIAAINDISPSSIQGVVSTADFSSSDLFLLNPKGFIFSGNAQLNLSGALHLGAIDFIEFTNGDRFHTEHTQSSILSSAPPIAFGLLSGDMGNVLMSGISIGNNADISVTAETIDINSVAINTNNNSSVFTANNLIMTASAISSGESITLDVDNSVLINNGSLIKSDSGLTISTNELEVSNLAILTADNMINITAENLFLLDGGRVATTATGTTNNAGDIIIDATHVQIAGSAIIPPLFGFGPEIKVVSEIDSSVSGTGEGSAGDIIITASTILLAEEGQIQAQNLSFNENSSAGDIQINTDNLVIEENAKIINSTNGSGSGGSININANTLEITSAGLISAKSEETATGSAGIINLTTQDLTLNNRATVTSSSEGDGLSGDIEINAETLSILDNSGIGVQSQDTVAGNIELNINSFLHIDTASTITTSVAEGTGQGGNVDIIGVNALMLLNNGSQIVAKADAGTGGIITFSLQAVLQSPDSLLSAEAGQLGTDGKIIFDTPDVDSINSAVSLPDKFSDSTTLISSRCTNRTSDSSHFYVGERDGLSASPDALIAGHSEFGRDIKTPTDNTNRDNKLTYQQISQTRIVCAK